MTAVRPMVQVLCAVGTWLLAVPVPQLGAQPRSPIIQDRVTLNPAQPVGFDVIVWPDSVYVGQQATYEMGVFISESAQRRMRRNPEVVPAELRGVLAYDLGGPQSLQAIVQNGMRSFPHILQRALFPLADGVVTIPASQLSYSLPRTNSYFSREEAAGVRASALSLHVKPLPAAGQPPAFSGAVGVLSLGAGVDVAQVRVGDPVVLTLRVGGRGNVKLWPRPTLQTASASLVEAGVRVQVDSTGQYIRGTKEFDWLVTPEREGRITIPVVDYPYFDPYADEYRVASSDALTIAVEGGTVTPQIIGDGASDVLGLRRDDRGPLPVPLTERPVFWAVLALLPFPVWVVRRRRADGANARDASHDNGSGGGMLSGALDGDMAHKDPLRVAAASLRRRVLMELATALDSAPATLVERTALEQRLRRRGVTRETTARVMALLADLDAAAWSPLGAQHAGRTSGSSGISGTSGSTGSSGSTAPAAPASDRSWTARCEVLTDAVRNEAMPSPRGSAGAVQRAGRSLALALCVGGSGWIATAATLHARSADFTNAVAQYDVGEFANAAVAFRRIAERELRHADAWANAGTAAWAQQDTAGAALGWQRALRLEPTAADVRGRLVLTGAPAESGFAPVASRPRTMVGWLAVVLWIVGCIALAWRSAPRVSRLALGTVTAAVMGAVWQYEHNTTLDDAQLAVVTSRQSLRTQPTATAAQGSPANTGVVVRRGEERTTGSDGDVWVFVTLDAEHAGWLPARGLQPLFGP